MVSHEGPRRAALSCSSHTGRGGCLLHTGPGDPPAQGSQTEPTGRGWPGLHQLPLPALLATPTEAGALMAPPTGERRYIGPAHKGHSPGRAHRGGHVPNLLGPEHKPPGTLCTDCGDCSRGPAVLAPGGHRLNRSKLLDDLDPWAWLRREAGVLVGVAQSGAELWATREQIVLAFVQTSGQRALSPQWAQSSGEGWPSGPVTPAQQGLLSSGVLAASTPWHLGDHAVLIPEESRPGLSTSPCLGPSQC